MECESFSIRMWLTSFAASVSTGARVAVSLHQLGSLSYKNEQSPLLTRNDQERYLCCLKLLRFGSCSLLQHNLAYPDGVSSSVFVFYFSALVLYNVFTSCVLLELLGLGLHSLFILCHIIPHYSH